MNKLLSIYIEDINKKQSLDFKKSRMNKFFNINLAKLVLVSSSLLFVKIFSEWFLRNILR